MKDNSAYRCDAGKPIEIGVAPQAQMPTAGAVKEQERVKRVAGEVQRQLNNEAAKRDEE